MSIPMCCAAPHPHIQSKWCHPALANWEFTFGQVHLDLPLQSRWWQNWVSKWCNWAPPGHLLSIWDPWLWCTNACVGLHDWGKLDAVQPQSICCVMCNMCNITQCPTNIQYLVCTHGCVVAIYVALSCVVSNVARCCRCNLGAVSRCSYIVVQAS